MRSKDRDRVMRFSKTTMKAWCILAIGLLAFVDASSAAGSMRCGSRLVAEGDSAAQLLGACGEPDLRDVWTTGGAYGPGALAAVEQWTYNLGSSQLLRIVQLRQGRIENIELEGYGFSPSSAARDCSAAGAIPRGMSKYRLLARCGAPLTRLADQRLLHPNPHQLNNPGWRLRHRADALIPTYREEWTYNFGSSKLMRTVILDNGSVSDVQIGERGFD